MIFGRYPDDAVCPSCGRPKVCTVYDGVGGAGKTPFEEILANYDGPCACAECADEGQLMDPITIQADDILHFQQGEVTGAELGGKIAGDQLVALKEQEKSRLKARGMTDAAADAEAWRRTLAVNRDLLRAYTRQPMGVEDTLRRVGQGDVIIQDGGVTYHLHGHKILPADKTQEAEGARKALWRRANQLAHLSPFDAALMAVAEHPELLEIILKEQEKQGK